MAVCDSLRSLLDSPMPPESHTLVEPLSSSWNQTHPITPPIEAASVAAEIFRELYFREKRTTVVELEPPSVDVNGQVHVDKYQKLDFSLGGYSSKSHEPLHMCTEGLGSESSDDVDDLIMTENEGEGRPQSSTAKYGGDKYGCTRNAKSAGGRVFPPPISSIGKGGRPWVCLRPYREDGRFVLRETRIPCRELLHASREDGRLKLHFVHPDKEEAVTAAAEEEEEEEEEGGTEISKKNAVQI